MAAENSQTMTAAPAISWEMLEKSLAHPNVIIREKGMEMAGRVHDGRAIAALRVALNDSESRVRVAAVRALARSAEGEHSDALYALTQLPDRALREVVAETLTMRRDEAAQSVLARWVVTEPDEALRLSLLAFAAATGGEVLLRGVIESLVDPSAPVRRSAESLLQQHAPEWLLSTAATEVRPVLQAARAHAQAEVARAAKSWCEALERKQLRRTMLDTGVAVVMALTGALRAASPALRLAAAAALQQSGDVRALPALVEALHDPEEPVRHAAAVTLGTLSWEAAHEEDYAAALVSLGRLKAATALGAPAVDALLLAATSSTPATQAAALECLAELKNVRSMPPLVNLLKSSHALVRRAAARALQSLEWVPLNDTQAIEHAVELEDWSAAIAHGAAALTPIMTALKASHDDPSRGAAILCSLVTLSDARAADKLAVFCRDGEVAATAVAALEALVENHAADISETALWAVLELKNVVQFEFATDPLSGRAVRRGLELVNVTSLQARATAELARRAEAKGTP